VDERLNFNAEAAKDESVQWVRNWFKENGDGCKAVMGISGGKDSSVVAALCVEALGKENVFGVMMPNHPAIEDKLDSDTKSAKKLIKHLDIDSVTIGIQPAFECIEVQINVKTDCGLSEQAAINLAPRLRMATLYAVSQSINGRVANTCNLSEDWVGYSTRYGDAAGDFAPLANFTVGEVKAIGYELGLPDDLIEKVPSDGLCGKTDEENLGFSYDVLDRYIRTGCYHDEEAEVIKRIDELHERNKFKMKMMDSFKYSDTEQIEW